MRIVDRRRDILRHAWKKSPQRKITDIRGIVNHHSLTESGSADAFARYHVLTNGWSQMGYTFVINRNGLVERCADYTDVTPHVGNYNKHYIGICWVGDFRKQEPTKEQYESHNELIKLIRKETGLALPTSAILGHQELPAYSWKQCPALDMDCLRGNIQAGVTLPVRNNFNNDKKIAIISPKIVEKLGELQNKVMWDDAELRKGQIGRITILKAINLWKRETNGKLTMVRILRTGERYRVYGYDDKHGSQYSVGGGCWITKMDGYVKYETPSKAKLEAVKRL
ncbi:N-acetylmuramoyl-L-alanine amidase [Cytobacillus firmus]|uniref:peptidoglycan recognition protein family protein n=1 Tax=Cytobacillus firmus TaxID=1399 RepID=UPI0018CDFAD6|nr:peptidoglycan recognition family protein [Cytobacillus firmus]MED1908540.1 peptidoglycan recognition family protein [Cytobacillus firmus]